MATKADFPGEHCKHAAICEENLLCNSLTRLSEPLTKGIIYELNIFRKRHQLSWDTLYVWLSQLSPEPLPTLSAVRTCVSRLEKKYQQLSKNKQHEQKQSLFREPLSTTHTGEKLSMEFVRELSATQKNLDAERLKTEQLTAKLRKLSVRNTNKKLKRRDEKIKNYKDKIDELEQDKLSQAEVIDELQTELQHTKSNKERNRIALFRAKKGSHELSSEKVVLESKLDNLEAKFELKIQNLEAEILNYLTRCKWHVMKKTLWKRDYLSWKRTIVTL